MAITVDGVADLAAWADSKSCEPWKASRSCEHPGCLQAQRTVDILSALHETSAGVWTLVEVDIEFTG